jgi:hypothetical protein
MKRFAYSTGEEVRDGDRVRYHGEPGVVKFVITERTGNEDMDWYLDEFPEGGFAIDAKSFGLVFLTESQRTEDLEFVSRRDEQKHDGNTGTDGTFPIIRK